MFGSPAGHHRAAWQLGAINVNHRGVGRAEFVDVCERGGVNLLGERQTFAPRLGQPDDFLEPGRAGGLEVQPGVVISSPRGGWPGRWKTCRCRNGR